MCARRARDRDVGGRAACGGRRADHAKRVPLAVGERLLGRTVPEHYEQVRFLLGRVKTNVEYHRFAPDDPAGLDAFLQQTRQELLDVAGAFGTYYFGHS